MAPLRGWASLGGLPGLLSSESASPSPWASQFSLQTPNMRLPHFCRDGNRVLKLANRFWKRQGSKMAHRGRQPQRDLALPGMGTRSPHRPYRLAFPSVAFLIKGGASYWVSDYYGINYVTPSLLRGTRRKSSFGPHTNPTSIGHLRQFPPLAENHRSADSSLEPRLLTLHEGPQPVCVMQPKPLRGV